MFIFKSNVETKSRRHEDDRRSEEDRRGRLQQQIKRGQFVAMLNRKAVDGSREPSPTVPQPDPDQPEQQEKARHLPAKDHPSSREPQPTKGSIGEALLQRPGRSLSLNQQGLAQAAIDAGEPSEAVLACSGKGESEVPVQPTVSRKPRRNTQKQKPSASAGETAADNPLHPEEKDPGHENSLRAHVLSSERLRRRSSDPDGPQEPTVEAESESPDASPFLGQPATSANGSAVSAAPASAGGPMQMSAVLQQLVAFAGIQRNTKGEFEFCLGMMPGVMGGLRVRVTAYGKRRIGLRLGCARGADAAALEAEVAGLTDELRKRGLEVVEVIVDSTCSEP